MSQLLNISISKKNIKKVANECVALLKGAGMNESSDRIGIVLNEETGDIYASETQFNSYTPGTIKLGMIKAIFPNYESEKYMEDAGIETTEENIREWDWENFTNGNDYENTVEQLIENTQEKINDLIGVGHEINITD